MTLLLATLVPGLLLLALGAALLSGRATVTALLKTFPRSTSAAVMLFGGGAVCFLYQVWHLSEADFGNYRTTLVIAFGTLAVLAFRYAPDFLAVRGLAVLILLGASPLLDAAYMRYDQPQRLFMVSLVYLCIALAIYLGAAPYRMRDFFEWLFRAPSRARVLGGILAGYGLLLAIVAFTY